MRAHVFQEMILAVSGMTTDDTFIVIRFLTISRSNPLGIYYVMLAHMPPVMITSVGKIATDCARDLTNVLALAHVASQTLGVCEALPTDRALECASGERPTPAFPRAKP